MHPCTSSTSSVRADASYRDELYYEVTNYEKEINTANTASTVRFGNAMHLKEHALTPGKVTYYL